MVAVQGSSGKACAYMEKVSRKKPNVLNVRILDMPICEVLGNYMVLFLQTSKLEIKEVTTCPRIIVARPEK